MSEEREKDLILSLTLAYSVIEWWEDNKDEDPFKFLLEPEFVRIAFDIKRGKNVL